VSDKRIPLGPILMLTAMVVGAIGLAVVIIIAAMALV